MTALDDVFEDLAGEVGELSARAISVLFAASAEALSPEFHRWAEHWHRNGERLLELSIELAFEIGRTGRTATNLTEVLRSIESETPPGDSADSTSSTFAQDCWICADVALRVHAEPAFGAGPAIYYAIEPIIQAASERLFGVSSLGAGAEGAAQETILLADVRVARALEFVRSTARMLRDEPQPDTTMIEEIRGGAGVLLP